MMNDARPRLRLAESGSGAMHAAGYSLGLDGDPRGSPEPVGYQDRAHRVLQLSTALIVTV
jgi:hypothetical protein